MDPWEKDRLGYQAIGDTFTNLVQSIDSAKVISIEAGFGRGKTLFRTAWSESLRQKGEVVVEIDAQQSDHSGDPVVTLLGALVEALPQKDAGKGEKTIAAIKKIGAIGTRTLTKIALKSAADDLIDAVTETVNDKLEDFDTLDNIVDGIGEGMSKAAGQFLAAQMAAEKMRRDELPRQMKALHTALLTTNSSNRVIVVIDELDRCHPDYAIAVLEAMKLVFNKPGFVFCLMVNVDYLENLDRHRFGTSNDDEKYLDKFVDIRLALRPKEEFLKNAVFEIASELPLKTPFGDGPQFSVEHAAELASNLATHSGLSMRKIKRVILKVEIALRCYANHPLDASLLVFLAFQNETSVPDRFLPRSFLTPDLGKTMMNKRPSQAIGSPNPAAVELLQLIEEKGKDLVGLPPDRYRKPDDETYYDWALIFDFLAPHYLPSHRDILNAVAEIVVPEAE